MISANIVKKATRVAILNRDDEVIRFLTYGTDCHLKSWNVDMNKPGK
jgi:hypothetical protein